MINTVYNALKDLNVPVKYLIRPDAPTSITFSFISIAGEVFADDKELETNYILQVDVWTQGQLEETLNEQVKQKLINIEYIRSVEFDMYEADTKIYHKVLRFNCLKNIEE